MTTTQKKPEIEKVGQGYRIRWAGLEITLMHDKKGKPEGVIVQEDVFPLHQRIATFHYNTRRE